MQLEDLRKKQPPPYKPFTALNQETGEYFKNFLVKSYFNYFYTAGKVFTHWLNDEPTNKEEEKQIKLHSFLKDSR